MTELGSIVGALATTLAAIIAGTIAFLSAILSKEQKTSEFRQFWIDAVRNDLADFVGETEVFIGFALAKREFGEDVVAFLDTQNDAIRKAAAAYHRIRLRLNPVEHRALLDALRAAYLLYSGKGEFTTASIDVVLEKIVAESHLVLKKEWKRVKRGEPPYFVTKYVALVVALVAIGILFHSWK